MKKSLLGMSLALILALTTVFPAFAEEVTVSGVVSGLDPLTCSFTLTTETAEVFNVTTEAGFDCSGLADGDTVEVTGESDGAGNLAAAGVSETGLVTGTVESIDYETCTFTVQTETGPVTVVLPEGTDCTDLLVGDTVEVTGTFNEETGMFEGTGVVLLSTDQVNNGFYCSNPTETHPALGNVSTAFGADYATLLAWFCGGGVGVGGVKHALDTAAEFGVTPEEVLTMRETMGWGQIWKMLASQGEDTELSTESHGKGGHGGGKPPWAGGGGNGKGPKNK
jgi:hypothetical protein